MKSFLTLCLVAIASSPAWAQPVINQLSANANALGKYEKYEVALDLTATYTNPFDYDQIAVQGIFTAPSGQKDTVDGFYMTNYSITDPFYGWIMAGNSEFKIRFSPKEVGNYSYQVKVTDANGSVFSNNQSFSVNNSNEAGFVRKNASTPYFQFDEGKPYFPIGQNLCWHTQNSVIYDYTRWMNGLAGNGANFFRSWMAWWSTGLEWTGTGYNGLKQYKQDNAFYMDWLLEFAKEKEMYMMLCLNYHGQVSNIVNAEWSSNPYNSSNGGPCANTWDYFTNSSAKNTYKNRLRYMIARWGYSPQIMAWEHFNEVEWTDGFLVNQSQINAWFQEMGDYIHSKDPNQHLITTSYANEQNLPSTWNLPNIDITQTHYYQVVPNIQDVVVNGAKNYRTQYGKPHLNGEFGLDTGGNNTTNDPQGISLKNTLWASIYSGASGAANSWWWDDWIDPSNFYWMYKAPAKMSKHLDYIGKQLSPVAVSTFCDQSAVAVISPSGGWGTAGANAFTLDAGGNLSPSAANLSGFLYGNTFNTGMRNAPTFQVTYPINGQFEVKTGATQSISPDIRIYVDGVQVLNQSASTNTTYSVNISAGAHSIKVDNLGVDWISISEYRFINAVSNLSAYVLKSNDNTFVSGYLLHKEYNWQKVTSSGAPSALTNARIEIPNMPNGTWQITWVSTDSGFVSGQSTVTANNGILSIDAQSVAWDKAFYACHSSASNCWALSNEPLQSELLPYPNPFSSTTKWDFTGKGTIQIFDLQGQRVAELKGENTISWKAENLAKGLYFYQLQSEKGTYTGKLVKE